MGLLFLIGTILFIVGVGFTLTSIIILINMVSNPNEKKKLFRVTLISVFGSLGLVFLYVDIFWFGYFSIVSYLF